jgi:phospholipase/lecithinase/hemolysin
MTIKRLAQMASVLFLFGLVQIPANAANKSLYVFGDSLSATADNYAPGGIYFYGQRWSNGRVWVEVLAQRQGMVLDNSKNSSYWDHNSSNLVAQIRNFSPPADVANALFVVWVCNADTYDTASILLWNSSYPYINANIQAQANHLQIITNLYAKGVRTLILPNAVDLSKIPAFNAGTAANLIHAECMDYNTRLANTINQARVLCPGLAIYTPDFCALLNNALTNAAYYGLTNARSAKGFSIDAYSDPAIQNLTLNGQGTNYIFWDSHDPTAKFHAVMADIVQQSISPVQISGIVALARSNQLVVANVPIGLNGFVEATTNVMSANWQVVQNVTSSGPVQSILVPTPTNTTSIVSAFDGSGLPPGGTPILTAVQFYRLRFPYAWQWP